MARPRTVCPEHDELIKLGQEMCDYVNTNTNVLHLSAWYSIKEWFTDSAWESMKVRPEFVGYYERAKKIVGERYLDKTSNVREGISQRWQRVYFKDLREQEDADKLAEYNLKNQQSETDASKLLRALKDIKEIS